MKQVIFLCFLSLTLCLAVPAEPASANHEVPVDPKAAAVPPVPAATTQNQTTPKLNNTEVPHAGNNTTTQPIHVEQQNATATPIDNKNVTKDEILPSTVSTPAPIIQTSTNAPRNASAEVKPGTQNATKPEENGTAKNGTTSTPVPPNQHDVPAKPAEPKSDEVKHLVQARGFDGPSFIGGIILTLGLLAIGFMGFRYYKKETERNYHTL